MKVAADLGRTLIIGAQRPETAMERHTIRAQEILPRQAKLQRVEAENVSDLLVEIGLLGGQKVGTERGLEPHLQIRGSQ